MRKMLRHFLDWLDARFPVKVVVTEKRYCELELRVSILEGSLQAGLEKQEELCAGFAGMLGSHEESIKSIKEILARPAVTEQARRAAYVSSGRMPD